MLDLKRKPLTQVGIVTTSLCLGVLGCTAKVELPQSSSSGQTNSTSSGSGGSNSASNATNSNTTQTQSTSSPSPSVSSSPSSSPSVSSSPSASPSAVVNQWVGTKQLGSSGSTVYTKRIVTDSSGNVYIGGYVSGGLDGNLSVGTSDSFITKYNSLGTKQWTKQLGLAAKSTKGYDLATDSSGNCYVVGTTDGGLDGNTLKGTLDTFVTKYNSSGIKQWTQQLGATSGQTTGLAVTADSSGNVYIAGTATQGLDGNTISGGFSFFLTQYDSSGTKQWTKQVNETNVPAPVITIDSSGNTYVTGYTMNSGFRNAFVTKYDSAGTRKWFKSIVADSQDTMGNGIAVDSSGNVYVSGNTGGALYENSLQGSTDAFICKYDSLGNRLWAKQIGAESGTTLGRGITTDSSGNVYLTGSANKGLDGNTFTGTTGFFVTQYNSSGTRQWTKQLGTRTSDFGSGTGSVIIDTRSGISVAVDSSGNSFVGGTTDGGLDRNTLQGTADFFITRYNSSGVKQ